MSQVLCRTALKSEDTLNLLTTMIDQDRNSPNNINSLISIRGLFVDPSPNSLNLHHENCMEDS